MKHRTVKSILSLVIAIGITFSCMGALAEEKNWITSDDITNMPETTIRYWFYETPERIALGQKQVEEFMQLYPNIKVLGSTAPDNTDNEMLLAYIKTQNHSSIQQSVNIEDLWYVDHDLLFPLNQFPDFEEVYSRFDPDLNYTAADGNVYSISWYSGAYVMYYNKAYLDEIGWDVNNLPKTYSEYYEFAKLVTDKDMNRYAISPWVYEEWWRWQFMQYPLYIAAQGNSDIFSEDGQTVTFNNEASLQSLTFFKTLFDNGWALGDTADIDPFVSGVAASAINNLELTTSITNNAAENFEYVIGPMPIPDGNEAGQFNTYAFVRNFALIEELYAKDEDEYQRKMRSAWEFMKFLLSDEQCAADFEAAGNLPCVIDLTKNPVYTEAIAKVGEKFDDFYAAMEVATIGDTGNSLVCEVMGTLQTAYLQVVLNGMEPAEALAQAEQQANQMIVEGRE